MLYYDGMMSSQVFWPDTEKLNFDARAPVRKLSVLLEAGAGPPRLAGA
jgi:hypothetical protein